MYCRGVIRHNMDRGQIWCGSLWVDYWRVSLHGWYSHKRAFSNVQDWHQRLSSAFAWCPYLSNPNTNPLIMHCGQTWTSVEGLPRGLSMHMHKLMSMECHGSGGPRLSSIQKIIPLHETPYMVWLHACNQKFKSQVSTHTLLTLAQTSILHIQVVTLRIIGDFWNYRWIH